MKMRYTGQLVLAIAALGVALPQPVRAAGESERMVQRASKVRELKSSGHIGEAVTGLLAIRQPGDGVEALVNAENADRSAIYAAIAAKQGVSAAVVGARRFQQLVVQAAAGDWLQRPDGSWYQK